MLREEIKNIKSGRIELRKFGLTIGGVLFILSGLLWWREKDYYALFLAFSLAFIILGVFLPTLLKPLQKVWMTLAILLGWLMTRLILSVLFYIVFAAIGVVAKLVGKQFLDLKMGDSKKSYWHYREIKELEKSDYERQF